MDAVHSTPEPAPAEAEDQHLAAQVFDVLGERLAARSADITLFSQTGCSFRAWCIWEAVAACHDLGRGWTTQPRPAYADVGVTGSREHADLLVFDPGSGQRVLIELSVIHDWSRNQWIDELDGDTSKLSRHLTIGITPLQLVIAASHDSPIDVNPRWQQWLGMTSVWNRPTNLRRHVPLGRMGQLGLHGWVLSPNV